MVRCLLGFLGVLANICIFPPHSAVKSETIPIIRASKNPLYGKIVLNLEKDLFLGSETDEARIFFRSVALAVDSKGNVYVLDKGNFRVQKFDREGRFIWSRGRKGEGPGEFRQPAVMIIDPKDHIYVFDTLGPVLIHEYSDSGAFVATSRLTLRFSEVQPNGPRAFVARHIVDRGERPRTELATMSAEGRKLKTIADFPSELAPEIKGHRLSNPYAPRPVFASFPSGGGVYGYSSEYKLFVFDVEGDVTAAIECAVAQEPITAKEKRDLVDRYLETQEKFPFLARLSREQTRQAYGLDKYKFRPFYSAILCDDRARIYVQRWKLTADNDSRQTYDVFSLAGSFLFTTELPFSPRLIKAGYVYATDHDRETGHIGLARYKVTNWPELRTE